MEKIKGGFQPRVIEREGPTGLLVTTAAVLLHPENETRLLSILVNDTPQQAKNILRRLAHETEDADETVARTPWKESLSRRAQICMLGSWSW